MSISKGPETRSDSKSAQNLFMAALVALGCWGMAFSFAFLTTEANHFLFGGMAAIMAMMWSYNFSIRLRKRLRENNK